MEGLLAIRPTEKRALRLLTSFKQEDSRVTFHPRASEVPNSREEVLSQKAFTQEEASDMDITMATGDSKTGSQIATLTTTRPSVTAHVVSAP